MLGETCDIDENKINFHFLYFFEVLFSSLLCVFFKLLVSTTASKYLF